MRRSHYAADMERTVRVGLDRTAEADLAVLRREGHDEVDAIRVALHEAAERRRRRSALRHEVLKLVADEEDLAETRRVRDDMDALAAPWPDD